MRRLFNILWEHQIRIKFFGLIFMLKDVRTFFFNHLLNESLLMRQIYKIAVQPKMTLNYLFPSLVVLIQGTIITFLVPG